MIEEERTARASIIKKKEYWMCFIRRFKKRANADEAPARTSLVFTGRIKTCAFDPFLGKPPVLRRLPKHGQPHFSHKLEEPPSPVISAQR
jgi:hypothetical protein